LNIIELNINKLNIIEYILIKLNIIKLNMSSTTALESQTQFKSRAHVELYIQEYANNHGFRATIKDSRKKPCWIQWKCHLGPSRHKETGAHRQPKTCPFLVSSKQEIPASTWNFTIQNAEHDHEPDYDLPKHDLGILHELIRTQDQKKIEARQEITQIQQTNSAGATLHLPLLQPSTSSNTTHVLTPQYQALQQRMQTFLPLSNQVFLLNRFTSEVDLAIGLATGSTQPTSPHIYPNQMTLTNPKSQTPTTSKISKDQGTHDLDASDSDKENEDNHLVSQLMTDQAASQIPLKVSVSTLF
jgi:hypothetical protein